MIETPNIVFPASPRPIPLSDSISQALQKYIERSLGTFANEDEELASIAPIFRRYADELRYICITHSLSDSPDSRLVEEEVVVGTIMATCSQHRFRNDRTYRMRLHAKMLVDTTRRRLYRGIADADSPEGAMRYGLKQAWLAWDYGMRNRHIFGANSFALIALAVIGTVLSEMNVVLLKVEKSDKDAADGALGI